MAARSIWRLIARNKSNKLAILKPRLFCTSQFTPVSSIPSIVSTTEASFRSGKTFNESFRLQQLKNLYEGIDKNRDAVISAIQKDYGQRSRHEILLAEYIFVLKDIAYQINNLSRNMKPKKIRLPIRNMLEGDSAYYQNIPYGNSLIISPWNFPFGLTLQPLAGAIAAGCTSIIKPSEITMNTSNVIEKIVNEYLDNDCYKVIEGGYEQIIEVLKQRFDIIFFTGGTTHGKSVAKAAAEYLTPTVLELGGKNPVIVDDTADIELAARRIAWGRYALNSGQICLAPEFVLCERKVQEKLTEALKKYIKEFFGEDPSKSKDYSRIINENHFKRINKLLNDNEKNIVFGGDGMIDAETNSYYVAPTILTDVNEDNSIMDDEVFGPLLSIYPLDDVRDSIKVINSKPKALSMYIYSKNKGLINDIVKYTDSGSICINDSVIQHTYDDIPFGGVGDSGMGSYHGDNSFECFSHQKPVLSRGTGMMSKFSARLVRPPFTDTNVKMVEMVVGEKPKK